MYNNRPLQKIQNDVITEYVHRRIASRDFEKKVSLFESSQIKSLTVSLIERYSSIIYSCHTSIQEKK